MRLRWILLPLGALVLIAAVGYYIVGLPPTLADDYEKEAEPEHDRAAEALRPVTDTFTGDVLGVLPIKTGSDPRSYVRRADRATRRDLRELSAARREVRRARSAIEETDTGAMTDSPSPPLIGGLGDLGEAGDVAEAEGEYLDRARAFLRDYDELLVYTAATIDLSNRFNMALAREEADVPKNPTSAAQVTGPLNRGIAAAAREVKAYDRLKAPTRDLRAEQRRVISELELYLSQQRGISRAVARDDFTRVRQIEREVARGTKRADKRSRDDMDRLLKRSRYRRLIDDLERRDTAITKLFEDL